MGHRRNLIVRVLGVIVILVGLHKTAWIVYNVFIHAHPDFIASNARSAGTSMFLGVAMVMLGGLLVAWNKTTEKHSLDADGLTPGVEETVRELLANDRHEEVIRAYCAATGMQGPAAEAAVARLRDTA